MAKRAATKTKIYSTLAKRTGLKHGEVASCIEALVGVIGEEIGPDGPGKFTLPGLLAIYVERKPAVKAHQRPDGFNAGKILDIPAREATSKLKVRVLKGLRDML